MLSSKPLPLTPGKSTKASIALVSGREFEVFQLIGRGKSTAQIAKKLHLSTKAVEAHREHVDRVRSQLVRDKG
jgi:DNA-binding CsgD family transcriptional regulator